MQTPKCKLSVTSGLFLPTSVLDRLAFLLVHFPCIAAALGACGHYQNH